MLTIFKACHSALFLFLSNFENSTIMGIFKTRANKRFDYTPRFYKKEGEGSPFEIKHKFDHYRKATANTKGLKNKFNNAMDDFKSNPNRHANKRVLIIVGILVLIFLFIIDFDLSIFLG